MFLLLLMVLSLALVYFFDFKQALEEFTKHYKFFTEDANKKSINKQKLHVYFISGIASETKKEVDGDKYGFFLEDFMKYYVIYANKKKAKKNEFDRQLINTNSNFSKNHLQDYMKVYLV